MIGIELYQNIKKKNVQTLNIKVIRCHNQKNILKICLRLLAKKHSEIDLYAALINLGAVFAFKGGI